MQKTKIIPLIILLTLIIIPSSAYCQEENQTDIYTFLDSKIDSYNANADKIPNSVKSIIGSEEIILKITQSDNTTVYISAKTTNAKITSFEKINESADKSGSLIIVTDETSINSLIQSPDPLSTISTELKSGSIKVESASIWKRIILWLIKSGLAKRFM